MKNTNILIPVLLSAVLTGCAQLPAMPAQLADVASMFKPQNGIGNGEQVQATQTKPQEGKRGKATVKTPKQPLVQAYTHDRAMIDLLGTDGRACTAASDTGTLGSLKTFAAVSAGLSKMAVMQSLNSGDFKSSLNDIKEKMQSLAVQTLWLPMESEIAIGKALLNVDSVKSDAGKVAVKSISAVKSEIKQVVDDYSKLSKEKYDSPYDFQILYMKSAEATMAMYPGGYLVVPDNLLTFFSQMPDQEREALIRYQIGHEVAHALRRHKTKWHQFRMVDAGFKSDGVADMLATNKSLISALNPQNVSQLFNVGKYTFQVANEVHKKKCEFFDAIAELHTRQELEADVCSVHMLSELERRDARYSFSPVAAMDAYERLKKRTSKVGAQARRVACSADLDHPTSAERRQNVSSFYVAVKARKP